jgi:Zn2+/Cd2+-exporting ATPase
MQTFALDLPVLLPSGPECDRCVSRLQERLQLLKGVQSAAVSGVRSSLQIAFDPDLVTVSRIEEEARRIGADLAVDVQHETIELTDIDCPDCAASIERDVNRLPGVLWAGANFASAQMHVEFRPDRASLQQICRVASDHGIRACALPRPGSAADGPAKTPSWWDAHRRLIVTLSALALTGLGIAAGYGVPQIVAPLCAVAILVGGASTFRGAWASLRSRAMDMNVLMSIAVVGAAVVGEWTEGASVVALYSLGNLLQAGAMERTRRSIRGLLSLAPQVARVERGGSEVELSVQQVEAGDVFHVKAGDRIPLDGEVLVGRSAVNEAPITGESVPVEKIVGDTVFGGTLNGNGPLRVRVTRRYRDTTLARIIHRVEEAQAQRAPSQQLIDRFARVYTPIVVALSVAVCLLPSVAITAWDNIQGVPVPPDLWPAWFMKGLSLLIIACPCALVISTPVAIVTAIGNASRHGALIKGGAFLESIGRLRVMLFDKTGTLTQARFELTDTLALDGRPAEELLRIASALEKRSEHPLASAFPEGESLRSVEDFESLPGMGARGRVDSRDYLVGSMRLMTRSGLDTVVASVDAERLEADGKTVVALAEEGRLVALFGIVDSPRTGAAAVVRELSALGIAEQAIVTGDNERVGCAVAKVAGISRVHAALLPDEKLGIVREYRQRVGAVGMVGDGINDAPALASADVGFAMAAAGSDTAIETADVALMGNDLERLPYLVNLSRKTARIIKQNIAFSLVTKVALIVAAVTAGLPLWLAVAGDVGVSLVVTLNALRLRS